MPAKAPATTKAVHRIIRVLMPTKPARVAFSRTASNDRPNAEWHMTHSAAIEATTTTNVK